MLKIQQVQTPQDWDAFVDLPWQIYAQDSYWVPPLRSGVRTLLDVRKNPLFRHALRAAWTAVDGKRVVGRIVAIVDDAHNQFHGEKTAFFGFFECIQNQAVANALLDAAQQWALSKGMETMRGPVNPSTNHESGLLVEGFTDPPAILMTYNPPYYADLLQKWGLTKAMDLYAYEIDRESRFSERILAQAERLRQNGSVRFRAADLRNFDAEIERILEIYNDAWEKNWGFVPMTAAEFKHLAQEMKPILDPELVLIAEVRGEPAAFALALPDVNQALAHIKNGKLWPSGWAKLLWHLKGPLRRRTVKRMRIVTLGIKKAYQNLGLGPLFYAEFLERGLKLGYTRGEASWILENNKPMNRALELMAGARTKVYRIYERGLTR